ncbi:MAG: hypothetical protein GX556_09330 [Fibrobacter sp.]|mgnify:CR=1 FL=1|nr:hypothetical protein [Fibrobacter sp.]
MGKRNLFSKLLAAVIMISCNGFSAPSEVNISGIVYHDVYPANMVNRPVSGAEVKIWAPRLMLLNRGPDEEDQYILLDSAVTDENGSYSLTIPSTIENIGYGTYSISVTHNKFVSRIIPLNTTKDKVFDILLVSTEAKTQIKGFVGTGCSNVDTLCKLQPVEGCTVEVRATFPPVDGLLLPDDIVLYTGVIRLRAVTNKQGLYNIDSIPLSSNGEKVYVSALKNGYPAPLTQTSVYNKSSEEIDFNLVREFGTYNNDTVLIDPLEPADTDSLTFSLFTTGHCCCSDFWNKGVSVKDTIIFISYIVSDTSCSKCDCESAGAWEQFKSAPIPAGHYAIYTSEVNYCPGEACHVEIMSKQVGEITIDAASPIKQTVIRKNLPETASLKTLGSNLLISLRQSSLITLKIYDIQGALLSEIQMGKLPAGNHKVEMKKQGNVRASEMVIVQMNVDGVSRVSKGVRLFY